MDSGFDGIKQAIELAGSLGIPSQALPWDIDSVDAWVWHTSGWELTDETLKPTGWTEEDYVNASRQQFHDYEASLGYHELERLNLQEASVESEVHRDDLILGTEEYSKYIDELIDDIHHVKKSLKTRSKKGSKHRKEAARLQSAIDSLRYMNRKNQRQLVDNNMINERLIDFVAPEENFVNKFHQKTKLTRDEIKSYFYRLKNE
jgi:hypothetical protein